MSTCIKKVGSPFEKYFFFLFGIGNSAWLCRERYIAMKLLLEAAEPNMRAQRSAQR